jgi:hypothetical protein
MDESRKTDERLLRATHARALLTDPLLEESMQAAEAALILQWRSGKTTAQREEAFYKLEGLKQVIIQLRAIVSDGTFAQKLLDAEAQKAQRGQSIVGHKE